MKKYNFLFKPLFFIFSLVFATWLVLYIEKIHPSDLGSLGHMFEGNSVPINTTTSTKNEVTYGMPGLLSLTLRQAGLKKACMDYKSGLIDSTELDKQIRFFLDDTGKSPEK